MIVQIKKKVFHHGSSCRTLFDKNPLLKLVVYFPSRLTTYATVPTTQTVCVTHTYYETTEGSPSLPASPEDRTDQSDL